MSRSSSFLPLLIFYLLIFLGRAVGGKKKKSDAQNGGRSPAQTGGPTPARPTRPTASPDLDQPARPSVLPALEKLARPSARPTAEKPASKSVHWHPDRKDECLYGEENHRYSHNSDRRVAQLKGYLEAGLIDRKEYGEMLERYTRMDRDAGLD